MEARIFIVLHLTSQSRVAGCVGGRCAHFAWMSIVVVQLLSAQTVYLRIAEGTFAESYAELLWMTLVQLQPGFTPNGVDFQGQSPAQAIRQQVSWLLVDIPMFIFCRTTKNA